MLTENNQPSAIKFSLDETVWFRNGEEISDLYGLSLEPNVTVQEYQGLISIRGSLKMHGEYKKVDGRSYVANEMNNFGKKYVSVIDAREEGISEFYYDFPVDITLPRDKVNSLEELDIVIEMFDYTLPENDCLRLTTNVAITGIAQDVSVYEREDFVPETNQESIPEINRGPELLPVEERIQPIIDEDVDESGEDTFSAEAKKVEERVEELKQDVQIPIQNISPVNDELKEIEKKRYENEVGQEAVKQEETDYIQVQVEKETIASSTNRDEDVVVWQEELISKDQEELNREETEIERKTILETSKEQEEPIQEGIQKTSTSKEVADAREDIVKGVAQLQETTTEKEEAIGEHVQEKVTNRIDESEEDIEEVNRMEEIQAIEEVQEDTLTRNEKDVEAEEQVEENGENLETNESTRQEKNINYQPQEKSEELISLTQFFGRKDENQVVRMKIYIVQQKDTLNLIAEKYDVTVSQILRTNQLEPHQDVYEGQILYIPTSANKTHSS